MGIKSNFTSYIPHVDEADEEVNDAISLKTNWYDNGEQAT